MPKAFLIGLQQKPLRFRSNGTVKLVATRFFAWGALPFLAVQSKAANSVSITLDPEWHSLSNVLEAKVPPQDYDGAITAVEEFLIARSRTKSFALGQIQTAGQMLFHKKGQFKIAKLAEHSNLSTRQLQRQFQKQVGVSPKMLARSIRFEEIRNRLMFHPDTNLTDLSYEFGYTDQAHFIRDFKEFTGKTRPVNTPMKCRSCRQFFVTTKMSYFYNRALHHRNRMASESVKNRRV